MKTTELSFGSALLIAGLILGAGLLFSMPTVSQASEDSSASSTVSASKKGKRTAKVDATCMQTAVDTREDALKTAWDGFGDDIASALGARKTALHDAWGLTDLKAQKTAIVKAWKDWKSASKTAHADLKKDRKATWDTFKKTVKDTCKISTPKDEDLGADSAGSISL